MVMSQKTGDILWGGILALWIIMLAVTESRDIFITVTSSHPYLGGFFKFAILATMGDLLGFRIINKYWKLPQGFIFKTMIWGILGMMITLVFTVFTGGVEAAQEVGRLPWKGNIVALAFFGSAVMNLTFGPMMYVYHNFADLYVDHCIEMKSFKVRIEVLNSKIDWHTMVSFSWLTTCLWIWIPCHTIVFLLPGEYRVLSSAFLSILLGVLIAFSKLKKGKDDNCTISTENIT